MPEPTDLMRFLRYVKEKIYDVRATLFKHVYNVELDRITYHYASLKTAINIPEDLYQAPLNISKRVQELSCKGITFIWRDQIEGSNSTEQSPLWGDNSVVTG